MPGEWQAQQAIPAILQVNSGKHNTNKNTTRVSLRGPFLESITAILTGEKDKQLLILHMLQSACIGTKIETGVDSKDDNGSQG